MRTVGAAVGYGDLSHRRPSSPVVAMASAGADGYWLVTATGRVFAFGGAPYLGGAHLARPVVAMAATPSGRGYWLAAADGVVASFGDAARLPIALPAHPVVGMAAHPSGGGYWSVTANGSVFAFGNAPYLGGARPARPVVGMAATASGRGYWLLTSAGGVFAFGDAVFAGAAPATAAGIARSASGYRVVGASGMVSSRPTAVVATPTSCSPFPADNPWNQRVDGLAVHPRSRAFIASIGTGIGVHPDFGTIYGIPYVEVPANQPRVPVSFDYADESDPGPYPIPPDAPIEGGPSSTGDRHVLVLDRGACRLWELFDAHPQNGGRSWQAGSGATWSLRSNALRPDGWTSADAAGLPILPGLVRYDEVTAGHIDHALRFTARRTQRGYVHPATHFASSITDANVPPMGLRVRLRAAFDCGALRAPARVVCVAMQRYGLILADNGSDWYVTGAPDRRWDDDALHDLGRIPGGMFEAVDTGPVITR
ncbi:MAG: hypothetical protein JF603_07465 [Acidobacteria bacterium]|nr:hypothetical protein [Acidobacteriota bacterium]